MKRADIPLPGGVFVVVSGLAIGVSRPIALRAQVQALRKPAELRGCVGQAEPVERPPYRSVRSRAVAWS